MVLRGNFAFRKRPYLHNVSNAKAWYLRFHFIKMFTFTWQWQKNQQVAIMSDTTIKLPWANRVWTESHLSGGHHFCYCPSICACAYNYVLRTWCMCAEADTVDLYQVDGARAFWSSVWAVLKKSSIFIGLEPSCWVNTRNTTKCLHFRMKSLSCKHIHCQHSVMCQRSTVPASRENKLTGKKKCA